jgi:formyl-CoA transferase/CoA:oxalate CoA-transferase
LGIGPDEVLVENPRLIYASISGFGQTGPDRSRPGYDLIVQALSGLMQVSAATGGPPVKVGFPIADILAGLFTGQGILAALHDRLLTGQGRRVEVSLLEALLASMCSVTSTYLLTGQEPAPMGTGQSNIVPYQAFECQDGPIVVGVPNERIWQRFCEALDRMDWLEDERYRGNGARNRHRADLVVEIEQTMRSRPRAEWLRKLEACEVPCAPILSIQQIFQHPQVSARHVAVEVKHPAIGAMRLVGSPMRLSGHATFYRPPPRLGEHTQDVLRELLADTADPEAARSRSRDHDCS